MATKPTPSKLADQYQTYPTASAAAVAALRGITNTKTETGGGILYNKEQNTYAATEPVGQGGNAHFEASVGVPKGWQLHSTYHTHPVGADSTKFSEDDIDTAQQLKAPSYVRSLADDKIRMFDPASSPIQKMNSGGSMAGGRVRYSNGSLVDETPPPPPAPAPTQAAPVPPVTSAPAAAVPVEGSRITMKDFASKHRAQTTKYQHKMVHVKIKNGAPKRP